MGSRGRQRRGADRPRRCGPRGRRRDERDRAASRRPICWPRTSSTARCARAAWPSSSGRRRCASSWRGDRGLARARGLARSPAAGRAARVSARPRSPRSWRPSCQVPFVQTAGPALERKGDVAAFLTALEPRSVFFVDELHRLPRTLEETFYPASVCQSICGRGVLGVDERMSDFSCRHRERTPLFGTEE